MSVNFRGAYIRKGEQSDQFIDSKYPKSGHSGNKSKGFRFWNTSIKFRLIKLKALHGNLIYLDEPSKLAFETGKVKLNLKSYIYEYFIP